MTANPQAEAAAGLARWIPAVDWIQGYDRTWLRPDLIAALTVWALVVPQAIAYAQIAGLPPQAGLFATAAGLVGYAVLGTSRQLIVSPTTSTAAISASLVGVIVISAVVGFLRVRELERIRSLRTDGFVLALVALVATLVLGILPGLITAVILALLTLLVRLARPRLVVLGRQPATGVWVARDRHADLQVPADTMVLRLEAPLLFLNAGLLRDLVRAHVAAADPQPELVVLQLSGNSELDIESLDILEPLASQLQEDGVSLRLGGVHQPVHELLERGRAQGAVDLPADFRTVEEAVAGRAVAQRPTMDEPMDSDRP